jgi:hypothetical protein
MQQLLPQTEFLFGSQIVNLLEQQTELTARTLHGQIWVISDQ